MTGPCILMSELLCNLSKAPTMVNVCVFFKCRTKILDSKERKKITRGIVFKQPLGTILLHVSKVLILTLVVSGVLLYCTIRFMSNSAVLLWLWFKFLMFKVDAVFRRAFY